MQAFLPRIARKALLRYGRGSMAAARSSADDFLAEETNLVVLLVDISGFTGLCDRFQGLGQQGIDLLTASLNRIFGVILAHIDAWGGDVVKFDGDALVVIWEPAPPNSLAETAVLAVECALALEAAHGRFDVAVPCAARLPVADQLGRLASTASSLYARNLVAFLDTLVSKDTKALAIDWNDELVKATNLTRDGAVAHPNFAPKPAEPAIV